MRRVLNFKCLLVGIPSIVALAYVIFLHIDHSSENC